MTHYFVDSTKTGGADDGSDAANAFLTLAQARAAAIDFDTVKVLTTHDEAISGFTTYFWNDTPGRDIIVLAWDEAADHEATPDWSVDILPRIASDFAGRGITLDGHSFQRGIHYSDIASNAGYIEIPSPFGLYENCFFESDDSSFIVNVSPGATDAGDLAFRGCRFDRAGNNALVVLQINNSLGCRLVGGNTFPATVTDALIKAQNAVSVEVIGEDLSGVNFTNTLFNVTGSFNSGRFNVMGCALPAGLSMIPSYRSARNTGASISVMHCHEGALTEPPIVNFYSNLVTGVCGAYSVSDNFQIDTSQMVANFLPGSLGTDDVRPNPISVPVLARANFTRRGVVGADTYSLGPIWVPGDGSTVFKVTSEFAHPGWGPDLGLLVSDQIWARLWYQNPAAQNSIVETISSLGMPLSAPLQNVGTGVTTLSVGSATTFTRPAGDFLADGFVPGMKFNAEGFANAGNNLTYTAKAVIAGTLTIAEGGLTVETGGGDEQLLSCLQDSAKVWTGPQAGTSQKIVMHIKPMGQGLLDAKATLASGDTITDREVFMDSTLTVAAL